MVKSDVMALREIRRHQVYRLERPPKRTMLRRLRRVLSTLRSAR
jgi:hypothetical protein